MSLSHIVSLHWGAQGAFLPSSCMWLTQIFVTGSSSPGLVSMVPLSWKCGIWHSFAQSRWGVERDFSPWPLCWRSLVLINFLIGFQTVRSSSQLYPLKFAIRADTRDQLCNMTISFSSHWKVNPILANQYELLDTSASPEIRGTMFCCNQLATFMHSINRKGWKC